MTQNFTSISRDNQFYNCCFSDNFSNILLSLYANSNTRCNAVVLIFRDIAYDFCCVVLLYLYPSVYTLVL
jgi:hypothetical protein